MGCFCFLEFLKGETGEVPPSEFQIRDTPAPCARNAGGSTFCSHFCTQQWCGYQPVSLAKNWKSSQGIFRHWEGISEFGQAAGQFSEVQSCQADMRRFIFMIYDICTIQVHVWYVWLCSCVYIVLNKCSHRKMHTYAQFYLVQVCNNMHKSNNICNILQHTGIMYVCMYVCMYVYMYLIVSKYLYLDIYIDINININIYIHT